MSSSQPPISKSLDAGWELFVEELPSDSDDETRTAQMSSPLFKGPPSIEDGTSDERDTLPPPVPVSEYVQAMMQVPDEPEPTSKPRSSPFSWHSAMPPSSRRGAPNNRVPSPSPARRVESWSAPAALSPPPPDDDDNDELDGLTLVAFEPERLGDTRDDRPFGQVSGSSPGFDDLPFDDLISASERADTRLPTPVPVLPSLRPPELASSDAPPLASVPPVFGATWSSGVSSRTTGDSERPGEPPATKRGLAAPIPARRAHPGTQRYGSIGDASVLPKPPSTQRAPISAPRPPPPPAPADPFDDVRELYDAGDFRSALVMAEALLETEPDHAEARSCAASCRETLAKKYLSRLGGLAKIPRVAMPPDEIRWLSLDHKAGFLLSCIDGTSSIEEVLDVACMQEFEAIRILHDFRELGVIEILPDPRSSRR